MSVEQPPWAIYLEYRTHVDDFIQRINNAAMIAQWLAANRGARLEATPSSWWRSVQKNQDVGGSERSWHLIGAALDVVTPNPEELLIAGRYAGLEVFDEGDHVHFEPRGTSPL